jgi:hypothetical protein
LYPAGQQTWRVLREALGPFPQARKILVADALVKLAAPDGTGIRPGNKLLAEATGSERHTIGRAVHGLQRDGLLVLEFSGSGPGTGKTGREGLPAEYSLALTGEHIDLLEARGWRLTWRGGRGGRKYLHAARSRARKPAVTSTAGNMEHREAVTSSVGNMEHQGSIFPAPQPGKMEQNGPVTSSVGNMAQNVPLLRAAVAPAVDPPTRPGTYREGSAPRTPRPDSDLLSLKPEAQDRDGIGTSCTTLQDRAGTAPTSTEDEGKTSTRRTAPGPSPADAGNPAPKAQDRARTRTIGADRNAGARGRP